MISTSYEAALAILSVEFAIVATFILFWSFRRAKSSQAHTTSQASELVDKVVDTEDARRQALETVFKDKYNYEGDELKSAVDEFMLREKAFYNAVVGAVLGRGDAKLADINDELTKVVAPWISITPKNMVDAKSAEALHSEKGRLEVELGETKDTLEKMITEYNRAFQVDEPVTEGDSEPGDKARPAGAAPEVELEEELDYQTEELHDLDEILESIAAKKAATAAPSDPGTTATGDGDEAAAALDPSAIVDLTDTDTDTQSSANDAKAVIEPAQDGAVDHAEDEVDELDSLASLDDDVLGGEDTLTRASSDDTPDDDHREGEDTLGKPMTADDLDELMGSLDTDEESAESAQAV